MHSERPSTNHQQYRAPSSGRCPEYTCTWFFCPRPPHTPARWGPYQQREWVVKPELDSPERCRMKNCPYGGCLQHLTYRQIEEAIDRRLAELK